MSDQTKIDDGGPAFPFEITRGSENVIQGMSLRDYFAAKALQGLLSHSTDSFSDWSDKDYADNAYWYADAMLVARKAGAT